MPEFISRIVMAGLLALATGSFPAAVHAEESPWRLDSALDLPGWISISGQQRVRFENLDNQFRAGRDGGDQILVFRTNVLGQLKFDRVRFAAEALDAREALADSGTPISTSDVNPIDLLQGYAELTFKDFPRSGVTSSLKAGRMTMDLGSRRFVARNSYRNTINAFTGADWQWSVTDGPQLRLFYTLPVQRRAGDDLLDAEAELDKETGEIRFWGAHFAPAKTPWGDQGEVFFLGLNEADTADFATRNRELYTAGFRLYRAAAASTVDYQLESVYQFGESRSSASAANTTDLDHSAHFQHAEIGYSFKARWKPRVVAQFDWASGDDDPADGENNQFDTLFGARRFDFGPTGIYGAFARANLISPGMRTIFAPAEGLKSYVALRGFWLASDTDVWTTAGVRDPTGSSGSYIGTQFEAQLQWAAIPGNLDLEAGIAHIFDGEIMESPPGNGNGDVTYFYVQSVISF